jgi:flagellar biosynthesis anti-sigma factor FlgM
MKGIISNHSALNAYQRQTAVDPVGVPTPPAQREGSVSGSSVKAARVSISAEARALAAGEAAPSERPFDRAKVEQLREALRIGGLKFDSTLIAQRMIDRAE